MISRKHSSRHPNFKAFRSGSNSLNSLKESGSLLFCFKPLDFVQVLNAIHACHLCDVAGYQKSPFTLSHPCATLLPMLRNLVHIHFVQKTCPLAINVCTDTFILMATPVLAFTWHAPLSLRPRNSCAFSRDYEYWLYPQLPRLYDKPYPPKMQLSVTEPSLPLRLPRYLESREGV